MRGANKSSLVLYFAIFHQSFFFPSIGNVFNFLTGFLFYPISINPDAILELMLRYVNHTGGAGACVFSV
jgi:hypothetical protein